MQTVLVSSGATDVIGKMEDMRKWLDARRYEPSLFKYDVVDQKALVTVKFRFHSEATDFAKEFRGSLIPAA
jgi:hypothetical protein